MIGKHSVQLLGCRKKRQKRVARADAGGQLPKALPRKPTELHGFVDERIRAELYRKQDTFCSTLCSECISRGSSGAT